MVPAHLRDWRCHRIGVHIVVHLEDVLRLWRQRVVDGQDAVGDCRLGDVVPLANLLAAKHGCASPEFTDAALRQLYSYHWPGNVRELDNVIQRAVVFADYGRIDAEHIFFDEPMPRSEADLSQVMTGPSVETTRIPMSIPEVPMIARPRDLQSAVRASEYDVIMDAIRSTRTREEAAKKLGISPRTLRYKMAKLRESSSGLSHCA